MKKTVKILVFLLCFACVERFCHKQTHGFQLHKIRSSLSFTPEWDVQPLPNSEMQTVKTALTQPYYYLDSGGQCYAFVSADGKYVLKFFKHHHMRQKSLLPLFQATREKRLQGIFTSCILAYNRFREGTRLL